MRARYLVATVAAVLLLAASAQARVGGTVAAFNQGTLVKKLGFSPTGTQNITSGRYKGMVANQYMSSDSRCFIDLIVSPKGAIVEQAILLPIAPSPMDATRFVEFMRDATQNTVNMNDLFKFISGVVQTQQESRRQFGRYQLNVFPLAKVVVDIQVTAAGGGAKSK